MPRNALSLGTIKFLTRKLWIVITTISSVASFIQAEEPSKAVEAAQKQFVFEVLPILESKCFACHGGKPDSVEGEFDLTTRVGLLKGGSSGHASIDLQNINESPLIAAVEWRDLEMPPKANDRLSKKQIESLRSWLAAGAPWPDADTIRRLQSLGPDASEDSGIVMKTSGGLSESWNQRRYDPASLWAYQPLKPATPNLDASNLVDHWIDHRLAEIGLKPAGPTSRARWIRRATFDLTGLPPSPAEVDQFINDPASDDEAYARVVDRLLQSPHYGEQWGRHWLDVVRYADSSGFANDFERGNAWRYRDYVIRAFNQDKPYDQFIIEQIAGDELLNALQRDPAHDRQSSPLDQDRQSELLIAPGFLRMGPWELTGMEVAKVARQRFLDDATDIIGQTFLGHMLQCARCHDHKFDPVPTRDYYSIQAALATTQLAERDAPFMSCENLANREERKFLEERAKVYQQTLAELDQKSIQAARDWFAEKGIDSSRFERLIAGNESEGKTKGRKQAYDDARRKLQQQGVPDEQIPPRHAGFSPQDFGIERVARKGIERLKWVADRYEPYALSVYSGRTPNYKSVYNPLRIPANPLQEGELEQTTILIGGDPFTNGESVVPAPLSAAQFKPISSLLRSFKADTESAPTRSSSVTTPSSVPIEGRRLALAKWIADPNNPLTARVMVNRIWQGHFGTPIAGNPNNVGSTGKRPTHPELLDELAQHFIASGWSIKTTHRTIMLSQAYRRDSSVPDREQWLERDPQNQGYAFFQPRRLTAEEIRDGMLVASGELNQQIGGSPCRPEIHPEVGYQPRMVMGTIAEVWQPSATPEQRHRRTIYALHLRGVRDPFEEVFNAPSLDLACEAREASTITPQAFTLINSDSSRGRALAFAARYFKEGLSREDILQQMFFVTWGRKGTSEELKRCMAHWEEMQTQHRVPPERKATLPPFIVRDAVEENTGEKFSFKETLEVARDFVPDLQPADVSEEVRGLAEVALVLLNSNEFLYVY